MNDIDDILKEAASRWQASQPDPPAVDPELFLNRRRAGIPRILWAMAFAGAIAVSVVTLAGPWMRGGTQPGQLPSMTADPREPPPTTPDPSSHPGDDTSPLRPGDRAQGTGVVVAEPDGSVHLCTPEIGPLDEPVKCSPIQIVVRGLEVESLPGWIGSGGSGSSGLVTVAGTWTGEALNADTAEATVAGPAALTDIPCAPPAGGWSARDGSDLEVEAALGRLADELAHKPDQFSGYWVGASPDGEREIAVVGTVGDPEMERQRLTRIFPFGLCVVRVEYSSADLARATATLTLPDAGWTAEISVELDRVLIELPLVDEAARDFFFAHPVAAPAPLVRKR